MINYIIPFDFMSDYAKWIDLCDLLHDKEETLAEIEGQHLAEVNHYGDSWPGAQIQIASLKQSIKDTKRKIQDCGFRSSQPQDLYDDIVF